MDAYPPDYITHNFPFVVLSGFNADVAADIPEEANSLFFEDNAVVDSDWPTVETERSKYLLKELLSCYADTNVILPRTSRNNDSAPRFHFKVTGRRYVLPLRKARPPPEPLLLDHYDAVTSTRSTNLSLHSPISPLTPTSHLYPDGIFTPLWIAKHQRYIPSVFISFFDFASDPTRDSIHDNQLKNEILSIKAHLIKSEYKIRLVVILLSDKTISDAPEIEDRLWNIKRATGLDPKHNLFFLPPGSNSEQLSAFVSNLISIILPMCLDYYRDLTKHARRKKNKGSIPVPTIPPISNTSQILSAQEWGARYEFKLGILAEFRGETEVASRHYSAVLEAITLRDGIFETMPHWSPRWNEARMLCDICLIRLIRSLFRIRNTTTAVQVWTGYRSRLQDLVDRKGKGSTNYGWKAWESRMSKVMSELIESAEIPTFAMQSSENSEVAATYKQVFCDREVSTAKAERLPPWQLLHHSGYWLAQAAAFNDERRMLAEQIPDEDRVPPDMSPASQAAHRNQTYDSYLCPEPYQERPLVGGNGFDHCKETVDLLEKAATSFTAHGQDRMAAKMKLQVGTQYILFKRHLEAYAVLRSLWEDKVWKKEKWDLIACEVTRLLSTCALQAQDRKMTLLTSWELASRSYNSLGYETIDFTKCLDTFSNNEGIFHLNIADDDIPSFLTPSFHFNHGEGHVGEPMFSQFWLASKAQINSSPIQVSKVTLNFDGHLGPITLMHQIESDGPSTDRSSRMVPIPLTRRISNEDSDTITALEGQAPLNFYPGQIRVFELQFIPREAGSVMALDVELQINGSNFVFAMKTAFSAKATPANVWLRGSGNLKISSTRGSRIVTVLPKPPKIETRFFELDSFYYTDETVILNLEVLNNEDEEAYTSLEVRLVGHDEESIDYAWMEPSKIDATSKTDYPVGLPGHQTGLISPSTTLKLKLRFVAPSIPSFVLLEAKVLYHLKSDLQTVLSRTSATQLKISEPFRIDFQFYPRVHPAPWPNYFNYDNDTKSNREDDSGKDSNHEYAGLKQKWQLQAKVTSLANEAITLENTSATLFDVNGGISCNVQQKPLSGETSLRKGETQEWCFILDTQKLSIEDRGSSSVDMNLAVTWRRSDKSKAKESNSKSSDTTTIEIPRLPIPSSEPRVLATAQISTTIPDAYVLEYTLENPTMHFLTFDLAMEASEDFAFSGCKYGSMNLLPISRQTMRINVLPLVRDVWLRPRLRIADRYFNKTLKVLPTEGLVADKNGLMLYAGNNISQSSL